MSFVTYAKVSLAAITFRRALLAGAAALGLYSVGDEGLNYVRTANRMVTTEVSGTIPLEFQLERAKTMIADLEPEIQQNMMAVAHEEAGVAQLQKEIRAAQDRVTDEMNGLSELSSAMDDSSLTIHVGERRALPTEVEAEMKRRMEIVQVSEATIESKQQQLDIRETALAAARTKIKRMLDARQALGLRVENLEARVRSLRSDAVSVSLELDDTQVSKCEQFLADLDARVEVSEQIVKQQDWTAALLSNSTSDNDSFRIERNRDSVEQDPFDLAESELTAEQ